MLDKFWQKFVNSVNIATSSYLAFWSTLIVWSKCSTCFLYFDNYYWKLSRLAGACAQIARYLGCIITDSCRSVTLIAWSGQKPQPTGGRARWRRHHQTMMLRSSWLTCRCRRSSGETPEETIEHICRAHRTFPQMRDQILQSEKQLVPLNAKVQLEPVNLLVK